MPGKTKGTLQVLNSLILNIKDIAIFAAKFPHFFLKSGARELNPYGSIFPMPQVIPISNFRSLSLLVSIL